MISRRKERLYEEAYSLFVGIHLKGTAGSVPAGARIPVRFRLKSHSSCYFKGARHSGGCRIYKKGGTENGTNKNEVYLMGTA